MERWLLGYLSYAYSNKEMYNLMSSVGISYVWLRSFICLWYIAKYLLLSFCIHSMLHKLTKHWCHRKFSIPLFITPK